MTCLNGAVDRRLRHVRGGGRRVAGQQTAQDQTPEHGGRGRADPSTVPAPVRTAPAAVRARVRGTPPACLVVVDAVHALVAVRPDPVAGGHLRPGRRGKTFERGCLWIIFFFFFLANAYYRQD